MKRSDITRELGYIDPEFIAEAASYKPRKISKIRIVALAACIAVLVTAIPLSLIMNREDPVQTPDTTLTPEKDSNTDSVIVDPKPVKVIYCDADEVSPKYLETNLFKDKNIKVENFEPFHYNIVWKEEYGTIPRTEDMPEKLTLSLRDKEYTAYFDIAYCSSNTDNEVLNAYAKIARYKIEGTEKDYIYYRVETKKIVQVDGLQIDAGFEPKYTEEEIAELACQDIKSIYGEKILEKYSINHCFSYGYICLVQFKRMIGDYDTGSWINMIYTGEGELKSYGTDDFGMHDFAEHLLNEKKLLEVEKEAQELIGDNLVGEKKLMIHKDGYVCVRYLLYLGLDERGTTMTSYIYFRLE